jgi:oligopeptidase B
MSSNLIEPHKRTLAAREPPAARRVPKVDLYHTERRVDDYFWLREKSNPQVAAYLEAENAYTDAVMAPTQARQEALYQEMLSHVQQTDVNVPYREGEYFYYSRTEEGKQYPIYCRKKVGAGGAAGAGYPPNVGEGPVPGLVGAPEAREEVVLHLNELAAGLPFLSLGAYTVSDDGHLLAYSTDVTGFREYTLAVKDLRTGEVLPDRVEKVGAVVWAADNATLFYTTEDHAKRSYRLYRHRLGSTADVLIYEEKDELYRVFAGRSRSKAYLFLGSASLTTTEIRCLPAAEPEGEWQLVAAREPEHEYSVDHHGDQFYIRTNDRGRNFRLVTAPVDAPGRENWAEVIPQRSDVMLEGVELFARHAVLRERRRGLPHLRVMELGRREAHDMRFPEPAYSVFPDANREWDTSLFRYSYQSLVTPRSVFDYDMQTRETKLLKQTEVPGYDPAEYATERVEATAADGVKVPISLVYRKGVPRDGTAPLYLYAYGSYGYPLAVTFDSNRLCLLDRGVVVALAHVRGGGEMGKPWHDDGRMMKKRNTFTDFIAAAEFLSAERYGAKDRLVIEGGSAGGLLMGAVVNMRPDLFHAVVSKVPFVDVINTMMDASIPLTVPEYQEWGNPNKPDEYEYMRSYCPYSNLEAKAYPAMLVKTSFNDSQVMYWEPAKYVAKLRTLKKDRNPLLLKTNMAAGHGGASGRYDHWRELAFDYAFILTQLGIADYKSS